MSAPTFSRLQLAAALIGNAEYDNDPTKPESFKSAKESAIFSTARRPGARPQALSTASARPETRMSTAEGLASSDPRASVADAMSDAQEPEQDSEPEVDLASWGLDTFIKPDKKAKKSNAKMAEARAAIGRAGDQTHQRSLSIPLPAQADADDTTLPSRPSRLRSSTMNNADSAAFVRPGSYAAPLDRVDANAGADPSKARPVSMFAAVDMYDTPGPRSGTPASLSFAADTRDTDSPFAIPLASPTSRFDPKFTAHQRTMSNASGQLLDNPFALPAPTPGQSSRFDPKASHARTNSNATMLSRGPYGVPTERGDPRDSIAVADDPYGIPGGDRGSTYGRMRTMSMASIGSRPLLDPDTAEQRTRPSMPDRGSFRYSKMDLMRPKVLVMPAPLQYGDAPPEEPASRDGFLHSTDGPPLPPAARTRPVSTARFPSSHSVAASGNEFTFNPRASLTLSQLTFRNTLAFEGQRDVSYVDIDAAIPRAEEDGEQAVLPTPDEPEEFGQLNPEASRAPGSLYGRSLMDDLERRKAQMKSKQRVFTGDERPSMMQRGGRRTTLIDPSSLQPRPVSGALAELQQQQQQQQRPGIGNRTSSAPLLDFGNERPLSNVGKTKSVFGVDQLWEKELAKLQQIEEVERQAAEEEARKAEAKASKKRRGKGKADYSPVPTAQSTVARAASPPPLLPRVPATGGKPVPGDAGSSSESESEEEVKLTRARRSSVGTLHTLGAKGWFASSDEEEGGASGTRRKGRPTAGGRPMQSSASAPRITGSTSRPLIPDGSDSDDVPLAAQLSKISRPADASDSDEDKPLAAIASKSRSIPSLPSFQAGGSLLPDSLLPSSGSRPANDDDDDDVPLGLRQSQSRPSLAPRNAADDDDDRPLGLQRMSQYPGMGSMPMMTPQVPIFTPQQMLMQAQMQHASMYSGAQSLMGGYAPFMGAPMMPAPVMAAPVMQDGAGKFGMVDRWRRDVVDEGGSVS
ncbi:hypothetical protein EXIGLDRAFT_758439 [Exidia glandulosa HHB12029]|uniref:Uncharacterized protein n=1 Tax=Exidia glandulosa HHB12029 TaxID=1314781 RepID=A0A165QVR6_EXIGL|nr:hypothetical protein EXIGLDRAFT_758439 [Exidia glandulosa HHB12029]